MKQNFDKQAGAEAIALQMLAFLAGDGERLDRFMSLAGLSPVSLRESAAEPQFLAGVMDHVLADQSLLLAFCAEAGIAPETAVRARQGLPGASNDF